MNRELSTVCIDPECDHSGSGEGKHPEPCPRCGYHDCDLDCGDEA